MTVATSGTAASALAAGKIGPTTATDAASASVTPVATVAPEVGTVTPMGRTAHATADPRTAADEAERAVTTGVHEAGPDFTRGQRAYLCLKRIVDAIVASGALVLLAPLLLLVWVAVLVALGRPAIFVQERVTLDGRRFLLRKFRTMRPEDPERGWVTDEQRLTAFGRGLRASSLDELPSLWNILVGDMSLVGPRPLPSRYLPLYGPLQHRRHRVRAGLTGLAQVSGRNNVPWDERLELDQRYVLLLGPLLDLQIFLRTFATVLSRDGVTEADHATSTDFAGPMRIPGLRFVPTRADSAGEDSEWLAVTSDDELIARCGLTVGEESALLTLELPPVNPHPERSPEPVPPAQCSSPPAGERDPLSVQAETSAGDEVAAGGPLDDALTMLISRARARGCEHAVLRPGDGDRVRRDLAPALVRAGFQELCSGGQTSGPEVRDHGPAGAAGGSGEGSGPVFTAFIGYPDSLGRRHSSTDANSAGTNGDLP